MRLALALVVAAVAAAPGDACPQPRVRGDVMRALGADTDVWGNALLRSGSGPTYAGARRYLAPLRYARAAKGTSLTATGVYYLPFEGLLHVADGSEIVKRRIGGTRLRVFVGGRLFGSCSARLADGWLPILRTSFRGRAQESFAWRAHSYVHVTGGARFVAARRTLVADYIRWPELRAIDRDDYERARAQVVNAALNRFAHASLLDVPERRVMDAQRALLLQNLALAWRYSYGNAYEEFSFPESVDDAEVLAAYGFEADARTILRVARTRKPVPYPSWKMGERLAAVALHYALYRDDAFAREFTPPLRRYVTLLEQKLEPRGLLERERFSSDIPDAVYGLHAQAVVWRGLSDVAGVWPDRAVAARARALAARLGTGVRAAVRASEQRLPDGSLFVPVALLDGGAPFDHVTASRAGSYWNLVMPYALASGLLAPTDARGIWRYTTTHGGRLLGLVRAAGFALYGDPVFPTGATDQVYGFSVARYLADADEPDQLVLSLYGQLAAAMTPNTFVAGEAASVAPLGPTRFRSMYLPPNSGANASFLETLRLILVHEERGALELAYATPRAWLAPGKHVAVHDAPTSFGPLTYSLDASRGHVRATVTVPSTRPKALRLRIRLPRGHRIESVALDGAPFTLFNPRTEVLDLTGRTGTLTLDVRTT